MAVERGPRIDEREPVSARLRLDHAVEVVRGRVQLLLVRRGERVEVARLRCSAVPAAGSR